MLSVHKPEHSILRYGEEHNTSVRGVVADEQVAIMLERIEMRFQ